MAMRSEELRTPSWLRVDISHDPRTFEYRLDIGVMCKDGWAHLVSMEIPISFGNGDTLEMRKAKAYELAHNFITRKLAIETLEST
jgi:hypothetical protein